MKECGNYLWLKVAYIICMTLTFMDKTQFFPWYMKYVMMVAVIGLGFLMLLYTGNFRHVAYLFEAVFVLNLAYIAMIIFSVLLWIREFQTMTFISRGCSTILYLMLGVGCVISSVYMFREKAVEYTFIAMALGNTVILFQAAVNQGIGTIFQDLSAFIRSGFVETPPFIRALEIHDLTFGITFYCLYYLICIRKHKRNVIYFGIAFFFTILGVKRIALAAVGVILVIYGLMKLLSDNSAFRIAKIIWIPAVLICYFYVYSVHGTLLDRVVEHFNIDMMGRQEVYDYFRSYYQFSPTYVGKGIGYITRTIEQLTEASVGIFGEHYFGSMHNDILLYYIELGFIGFFCWIWYHFRTRILWIWKSGGKEAGLLMLYATVYLFITYTTDNTSVYSFVQITCILLPLAEAVNYRDKREGGEMLEL